MTAPLDVLLVGETDPGGLTGSYARGFEALGLSVEVADYAALIQRGVPPWLPHTGQTLGQTVNRPSAEHWIRRRVAERRPRLVFILKCDDLTERFYGGLRAASPESRIAAFHPDDPFKARGLLRRGPSHPRAVTQIRLVDHYFVWAPHLVENARAAGARHVGYLAFGFDPLLHAPLELTAADRERFSADVAFIGNWDAKREAWLAAFDGSGLRLAIWGSDYWKHRCRSQYLRSCWRGHVVVGGDFRRAVAGAKVCVNVLRRQNEGGHNMRTFEVPGCGGFLLAEWSGDQAGHFRPDVEAVYALNPKEMAELARHYCENGPAREAIRAAGHARATVHTYAERAREVVDAVLGGRSPPDRDGAATAP